MRTRSVLEAALLLASILVAAGTAAAQQNDINDLPRLQQQSSPQTAPQAVTPVQPTAPAAQSPPAAPAPPAAAPQSPPAAEVPVVEVPVVEVRGPAQVLDTGNLIVQGRAVSLFGILGLGPPYDKQLASYLAAQGGAIDCIPEATKYICKTASGYDVAAAALFNGGARAGPDAPPDYLHQQDLACAARRGIWAHQH